MNKLFRLSKNMSTQARNAILLIGLFLLIELGVIGFLVFQGLRTPSLLMWILIIAASISAAFQVAGMVLSRRGRHELGIWLAFLPLGLVWVLAIFILSGLGYVMMTLAAVTFILVANLTLSSRQAIVFGVVGIVSAIAILLLDVFLPAGRITIAGFSAIVNYLVGAILLIFGYIIIRQYRNYSLRAKLITAFIGVTLVVTGVLAVYVYISTTDILRQGLERELIQHTHGIASGIADLLKEQVNSTKTLALNEVLEEAAEDANNAYDGNAAAIQSVLEVKDAQWRAADAADNNNHPLVHEYLNNTGAHELKEFQEAFPNHVEMFITDVYGGLAGTTNRTSDFYQADEDWWQAAYNNGKGAVYISEPEYDESADALAVLIAVPMRNDETGEIVGILRTTYLASGFNSILGEQVGETSMQDILIPAETPMHYHQGGLELMDGEEFAQLQSITNQGMVEMYYEGADSVVVTLPVKTAEGNSAVDSLGWMVLFHQYQDEAFAPVNEQMRGVLIVIVIVIVLAVGAAIGLSWFLVRPISQLTQTAEEVAGGNLNSRAEVTSTDEVGTLATTFNSMTSQLQETLQGLEQRVAARTRDLATVAEVGTATATILESKRLLQEVVDLTKERFNLYHSHIYLLDEAGKNLVLTAGAGEPGRVMVTEGRSIPLDREQSLVARAARERKGVTVNDVTQAPDFLPNPLLPNTRSELAVPMIVGSNLIGVFDIQSDQVGRFTDSDISIQTTLAAQVATSIQNVRSFEQSKAQAELESLVNTIGQKIQRATTVEDTLQTAIREVGLALGASRVSVNIQANRQSEN